MAGLILASFRGLFPEFVNVSDANIQTILDTINCGYQLIELDITDSCTLNIYYWLGAHLAFMGYNLADGSSKPASPMYGLSASATSRTSVSFINTGTSSLEQSFINSTRYGQMFSWLCKQRYIHNTYGL
jgi:hypothetical protein